MSIKNQSIIRITSGYMLLRSGSVIFRVVLGQSQIIMYKKSDMIAIIPIMHQIEKLEGEVKLHKNLATKYAQALRGEGIFNCSLKKDLKTKKRA